MALRPEMTPTLARMVASQHRNYRKPIKWFSVPRLFRYERPQKGRHREHYQWNCDMVGEKSAMAEAELIGTLCLGLSLLGLNSQDVVVRVSDRNWWDTFLEKHGVGRRRGRRFADVRPLGWSHGGAEEEKLGALAGAVEEVWQGKREDSAALREVHKGVNALGYVGWCETDYRVVRGLAYYTGVFLKCMIGQENCGRWRGEEGMTIC